MDVRFYMIDEDFYSKAKRIDAARQEAIARVNKMQQEVLSGKEPIKADFYYAYLALFNADSEYAKLYLDYLKEAYDKVVTEVNEKSVVSTDDAKKIVRQTSEIFEAYSELCETLEQNKSAFEGVLSGYYSKEKGITLEDVNNSFSNAFMNHLSEREKASTFVKEVIEPHSDKCDQFVEDLQYLNVEFDNYDDDDEELK